MPFSLPQNFQTDANELGRLVVELEAAVDEAKKDEYTRKALVVACQLLSSIDLKQLRERVVQVFASAEKYDPDWFGKIVGDEAHFKYFLSKVESAVIDAAGIDTLTRNRILDEIGSLRATAVKRCSEVSADSIGKGIEDLRTDVCQTKNRVIKKAERAAYHTKIVKTLCVVAILADAVGQAISPVGSPGAFAASIVVGGIRFIPGAS